MFLVASALLSHLEFGDKTRDRGEHCSLADASTKYSFGLDDTNMTRWILQKIKFLNWFFS
jgi:hypothetical protein